MSTVALIHACCDFQCLQRPSWGVCAIIALFLRLQGWYQAYMALLQHPIYTLQYPTIMNHNVLSQDTQNWLVSWTVGSDTVNAPRGKKFHWYFCRQTCIMFMGRQTWPQKSERCAEERRVLPGTGSIHLGEEPVNVGFESVKKKPFCWMQQIILPGSVEVSRKVQRPAQRKANSPRPCLLQQ